MSVAATSSGALVFVSLPRPAYTKDTISCNFTGTFKTFDLALTASMLAALTGSLPPTSPDVSDSQPKSPNQEGTMFSVPNRSRIIAVVLLFSCAALLVIGAAAGKFRPFSRSSHAIQPRVTNKTSSVRISKVLQLTNGDVEVTFLNQSTKAIYAYTMITSEHPTRKGITVFATATPVAPGETKAEKIPGGNLESAAARNPDGLAEIVFSAVYLEGGVAEGDARDSEKLKQTMGGMKEQSRLALQILLAANTSPDQDVGRRLEAVESQVASMPVKDESAPSSREREFGRTSVNDRLVGEIKKLRMMKPSPDFDVNSKFAELISYYKRLAERL